MKVTGRVKRRTTVSPPVFKWAPTEEGCERALCAIANRKLEAALRTLDLKHPFKAEAIGAYVLLPDHSTRLAHNRVEWLSMMEERHRVVAQHEFPGREAFVSTIFLTTDPNFRGNGTPMLFETMANIGGEMTFFRYATYDEAFAGHTELVRYYTTTLDAKGAP